MLPFFFWNAFETEWIAQAIRCRSLTAEGRVEFQASLWGLCDGQSGTRTGCATVSPVTLIPAVLHAHSFVYR